MESKLQLPNAERKDKMDLPELRSTEFLHSVSDYD
jgi:hypothetical protein